MEIIQQLGALSYLGVFIIGLLANIVIPVPEEVSLITLGYLSGIGAFHIILVVPLIVIGLLISDLLIYWLSKKGSKITQTFYHKFFASQFQFLQNIDNERLEKIILFSRFFAFFRFLAPFLGGMYKVPVRRFIYLEVLSISLYSSVYLFLGFFLRNQVEKIISGVNIIEHVVLGLFLLVGATALFTWLKQYFTKNVGLVQKDL